MQQLLRWAAAARRLRFVSHAKWCQEKKVRTCSPRHEYETRYAYSVNNCTAASTAWLKSALHTVKVKFQMDFTASIFFSAITAATAFRAL